MKTKYIKKYLHLLKLGFRHTTEKSGEKCYKRKNEKYDTRLFDNGKCYNNPTQNNN